MSQSRSPHSSSASNEPGRPGQTNSIVSWATIFVAVMLLEDSMMPFSAMLLEASTMPMATLVEMPTRIEEGKRMRDDCGIDWKKRTRDVFVFSSLFDSLPWLLLVGGKGKKCFCFSSLLLLGCWD